MPPLASAFLQKPSKIKYSKSRKNTPVCRLQAHSDEKYGCRLPLRFPGAKLITRKRRSEPSAAACFDDWSIAAQARRPPTGLPRRRPPAAGSRGSTAGLRRPTLQVYCSNLMGSSPGLLITSSPTLHTPLFLHLVCLTTLISSVLIPQLIPWFVSCQIK